MSRRRAAVPAILLATVSVLVLALVLVQAACGGDGGSPAPDPPAPPPEPVGVAAYGEILRERAGLDLAPAELAASARRDAAWIEARLDRIAAEVEPGAAGWRPVYDRLRRHHPPGPEAVLDLYRRETERARKLVEERGLMTLPQAPFEVIPTSELSVPERYPLTAYVGFRLAVAVEAADGSPRLAPHCTVCVPPLAVHEAFPGHHAAFLRQRAAGPEDEPEVEALLGEHFRNRFFHEGWAQYAEMAMLEAGFFDDSPERRLGAWRSLLSRVRRAEVDPLLHSGDLSPEEALRILSDELMIDPALAADELRGHLAEPGLKAAYYVGLVQVLALRRALEAAEGEGFSLRAFHDRFVERPMPVPAVARLRFGVEPPLWPQGGPEGGLEEVLPSALASRVGPGAASRR